MAIINDASADCSGSTQRSELSTTQHNTSLCPRYNLLARFDLQGKFSNTDDIFQTSDSNNVQPNSIDAVFEKKRVQDPERYWFLKPQPLELDESEILCEKKSLLSLIQAPEQKVDASVGVSKLCTAVIQSQALPKDILKKNALKKIKPPSRAQPQSSSAAASDTSTIKNLGKTENNTLTNLSTPSAPKALFRVSLASGGGSGAIHHYQASSSS